jgi:hypothetical protein
VDNVTNHLTNVNLICVHGNLVVIKALLQKFIISSDEETAQQHSHQIATTFPHLPGIPHSTMNGHHFPLPMPVSFPSLAPPPYVQEANGLPSYSGVVIEDKDGHNPRPFES